MREKKRERERAREREREREREGRLTRSMQYGPFRPNVPVVVPLWVALALKQSGSCTIELDDWFKLENILATQEREKTDAKQLQVSSLH